MRCRNVSVGCMAVLALTGSVAFPQRPSLEERYAKFPPQERRIAIAREEDAVLRRDKADHIRVQEAGVGTSTEELKTFLRRHWNAGDPSPLKETLAKLSHDDFAVREKANEELLVAGMTALPLLLEASNHSDTEVAGRARRSAEILKKRDSAALPALRLLVQQKAYSALAEILGSSDYFGQWAVTRALCDVGKPAASTVPALFEAYERVGYYTVHRLIEDNLRTMLGEEHFDLVVRYAKDPRAKVRAGALSHLGMFPTHADVAVGLVLQGMRDADPRVRRAATRGAGGFLTQTEIVTALKAALKDPDRSAEMHITPVSQVAAAVFFSLGPAAEKELPALVEAARQSPDHRLRGTALRTLAELGRRWDSMRPTAVAVLTEAVGDTQASADSRAVAANGLSLIGKLPKETVPTLRAVLREKFSDKRATTYVKSNVLQALESLGRDAQEAAPEVEALLKDEDFDRQGREIVLRVLKRIVPPK